MQNINVYLRENLGAISSKMVSVAPNIDDKKLNNAVKAFSYTGSPSSIIAILDTTLFGSGKDGLIFTGEQFIYRQAFSDPINVNYSSIAKVEYIEAWGGSKKDKLARSVEVTTQDGRKIVINDLLSDGNYSKLAEILQSIICDFEEYKEEEQFIPIDAMGERVKVAYLKVIINMARDNDGIIDAKELAEIFLLMRRLNVSMESRSALHTYMASTDKVILPLEKLLAQIDAECPEGQIKSLHISLAKDLINLFFCIGGSSIQQFGFLQKNRNLINVSDEEIELIVMAIQNDHNMLKDDVTDDQIVSALKALSAKAAAIGTPLAAVYLSGSVVGLSAAGLTSGLATLGLGGMLGLSSMATGVGVAVLIGVGVYAGVRKLSGTNELSRSKRKELMLNEVIKQRQYTISDIMQYINYLTDKLNKYIEGHRGLTNTVGEFEKVMVELMNMNAQLKSTTSAGVVLTEDLNSAQGSATKLHCATVLDENKLKSLTREPTKANLYDFIISFYEEKVFIQEKNGQKNKVIKLVLKQGHANKELDNLAKSFEAIGYFNVADVLKGSAADLADKAKSKLTGLFS